MDEHETFWMMMCVCYLIGGMTIGWLITTVRQKNLLKKNRTGTGRWDYKSNRKDEDTFK